MSLDVALTTDMATCHALRRVVFIEEQNVPEVEEVDGRDGDALHILARLDGQAVGCARILIAGETGKIGRVCVLRDLRGQGIGIALINAALAALRNVDGVTRAKLGAQTHAIGFYEALGFVAEGPEYLDAGIAHRDMARAL
ncbi:ElaA protein [Roseinatronobacter thiooxidans]|uniref:ElaA protein n=1 Tax=Roseinatronobacter thiooxidans TaxID=121821 RepID=A0A2W7R1K7_9RHOB|nr:GNAT family N-acetyltransferase [Roseinatronobacter thiooxidans]PZX47999.1 ElaA protein [Roseinatronobacter thiooxidans]